MMIYTIYNINNNKQIEELIMIHNILIFFIHSVVNSMNRMLNVLLLLFLSLLASCCCRCHLSLSGLATSMLLLRMLHLRYSRFLQMLQ